MHDEFDTMHLKDLPEPPSYRPQDEKPKEVVKPKVQNSHAAAKTAADETKTDKIPPKKTTTVQATPKRKTPHTFKGQQKYEKVICAFRKHWIVLLPYLAAFLVGLLFFIALIFNLKWFESLPSIRATWFYELSFVFGAVLMTYYFHRFFIRLLNYYTVNIIITNYRIVYIKKTVFFRDDQNAIDLHEIQDIKKIQDGFFCTILNFGDLEISLPAIGQLRKLHYVPAPNHYFRCINQAKRDYILSRRREKYLMEREHRKEFEQANLPQEVQAEMEQVENKIEEIQS